MWPGGRADADLQLPESDRETQRHSANSPALPVNSGSKGQHLGLSDATVKLNELGSH